MPIKSETDLGCEVHTGRRRAEKLVVRLHHTLASCQEDEFLLSVAKWRRCIQQNKVRYRDERDWRLTLGINCSFSSIDFIRLLSSTCCSYCVFSGTFACLSFLCLFTWNGRSKIAEANLQSASL